MSTRLFPLLLLFAAWVGPTAAQIPLGDPISLQGSLRDAGAPAQGVYDFRVRFYDGPDLGSGNPTGPALDIADVPVETGVFHLSVDPPDVEFVGERRWVQVSVRPGASSGAYTDLLPLIAVAPAPQSLYALQAQTLLGFMPDDFAAASHVHAVLAPGAGLTGGSYDGSTARSFAVDFGVGAGQAVAGNQALTVTAGAGLGGGTSNNALGDGASVQLDIGGGNGITVSADSVAVNAGAGLAFQGGALVVAEGAGLMLDSGVLNIGEGAGIVVGSNQIAARVDNSTIGIDAGNRLSVLPGARVPQFRNVAIVALAGGSYPTPQAALAALASWCTNPSAAEPCRVWIMPGEYPVSSPIVLRSHVELHGFGAAATVLVRSGAASNSPLLSAGSACASAAPCVVADLGLRLTGSGATATAISASAAHLDLRRVDVAVAGGSSANYGLLANGGSLALFDSDVLADGKGSRALDLTALPARISRSELRAIGEATYGLRLSGGSLRSDGLRVEAREIASGSFTVVELSGTAHWQDRASELTGGGGCASCVMLVLLGSSSAELDGTRIASRYSNAPGADSLLIVNADPSATGARHNLDIRNATLTCDGSSSNCIGLQLAKGSVQLRHSELYAVATTLQTLTPPGGSLASVRVVASTVHAGADALASVASGTSLFLLQNDLIGGSVSGAGSRTCRGNAHTSGFLASSCP